MRHDHRPDRNPPDLGDGPLLLGRLVRVEGPDALIVIDRGDRDELRTIDAAYLSSMGIENSGDPFVLHQLQWSPDTIARVFVPAVDLEERERRSRLEAELEAMETPLPRPRAASAR